LRELSDGLINESWGFHGAKEEEEEYQALLLGQASKSHPTKNKAYLTFDTFSYVATNQASESRLCCLPSQAGTTINMMCISYIFVLRISSFYLLEIGQLV
jgi:hypothetical protein